jgi:stalled ribosome rescue protein Dom34
MHARHAAVWLDHNQAKIFHVGAGAATEDTIHSFKEHTQLHRRAGSDDGHRAAEDKGYYHAIASALEGAEEILVVGPATAKLVLIKHIHEHHRDLVPKIVGVETVDHPSDGQLVAYARRYFAAADRMQAS